eukprot:284290-Chlamydomonas_euryale.AAC.5
MHARSHLERVLPSREQEHEHAHRPRVHGLGVVRRRIGHGARWHAPVHALPGEQLGAPAHAAVRVALETVHASLGAERWLLQGGILEWWH